MDEESSSTFCLIWMC